MSTAWTSNRVWLAVTAVLALAAGGLLLSACDLAVQPTPAVGAPVGAPTDTPAAPGGPSAPPLTLPPEEAAPSAPAVITLTVWTTEAFSPTQAITGGQALAQQAAAFEAAQSDVRLHFVLKKPYGKGGLLDYLLTTKAVVPDLLPDLAILDVDELGAAVQAETVQPLDDLLPPALIADLFPFVREASTFDGRLYGLQFQADLDHLVYNTGQMTIPPRSWPGVLSNPGPYLFPAGGEAGLVNDAFLIQYLAVRAQPTEEDTAGPFLEVNSLTAVLQFYQDGIARGIFPPEIINYHATDECWRDYLAGQAVMTQVSTHRYLADRDQLPNSVAASIPAINGPGAAIGRGWVLALTTPDPARQSVAVEFMVQLMAPEANAAWSQAAGYLPTRQAALDHWDRTDSYTLFIQQQLLAAQPRPAISNYAQVAGALQKAVEDVITGAAAPEEAATEAIESVQ